MAVAIRKMARLNEYSPDRLEELRHEQRRLAKLVDVPEKGRGFQPKEGDLLVTLDVQYVDDVAFVSADLMHWPQMPIKTIVRRLSVSFPYISQFFAFREGPLLIDMIHFVQSEMGEAIDFLLIDGHGRAHPRKFGIACFVGLETGIPTIGCAKEPLLHFDRDKMDKPRGSTIPLLLKDDVEGANPQGMALVTQDNVRPLFVSPGHLISNETACRVILQLASRYRQPEPIRRADQAARRASKN